MRKPRIENKYNLKPSDIPKLKVTNREAITKPPFWRNNVIQAWCLTGGSGKGLFGPMDSYWLGIYDEDAKAYKGKIRVSFSAMEDMCNYKFTRFYDEKQIEKEYDLEIQELFLEKINWLLDEGILVKENDIC